MRSTRRTALRRYARLEAVGLWRPAPEAPAREVGVSLGEATLTIEAGGRPLAHWSLPAVERLGRGEPARYAAAGGRETVEIADPEMVAAIERVRRALARRAPRRSWARIAVTLALTCGLAVLAASLPDLLRRRVVEMTPPEVEAALGEALLGRLGRMCPGSPALDALSARLAPGGAARIAAVEGPSAPAALPGGIVALPPEAITTAAEPGVTAGRVLAAVEASGEGGALDALLSEAGTVEALRLMTSARVSGAALDAHAARLAARPAERTPPSGAVPGILARFDAAELSSAPYGRAARIRALSTLDPHPDAPPALPDAAWIALQSTCED